MDVLSRELLKHWTYRVFAPGALSRARYEAFCELLTLSEHCQERIACLEGIHHGQSVVDWSRVAFLVQELDDLGGKIVAALTGFSPSKGVLLLEYFRKIAFYLKLATDIPPPDASPPFVLPLTRGDADTAKIGGKAAGLAWAMNLPELPVPQGFVITAGAFHYFLEANNLRGPLDEQLRKLSLDDPDGIRQASAAMVALLSEARIPSIIRAEMEKALSKLATRNAHLAVRSSVAARGDVFAFPGQYDSFLNILPNDLPNAWRRVVMGKYSPRALTYRILTGLSDMETPMAALVMPMVDAVHSGVCYTRDIDRSASLGGVTSLYAVPGLGENLVGGRMSPGVFTLDAETSLERPPEILQRPAGFAGLSDATVTRVARLAMQLTKLFKVPQAVEWAVDKNGRPWILQSRSILPQQADGPKQTEAPVLFPDRLPEPLIADAVCVSPGAACGPVVRVHAEAALSPVPTGAILVVETLSSSLTHIINRVGGIISQKGSRASHFACVAREFGLPVIACESALALSEGTVVTLDALRGNIFPGCLKPMAEAAHVPRKPLAALARARQEKLLPHVAHLNLADPDSPGFRPEGCRSVQDVAHYAKETAVREMFAKAGAAGGLARVTELKSRLPLLLRVLDLGRGLFPSAWGRAEIAPDDITSTPMWALWLGFSSAPEDLSPCPDQHGEERLTGLAIIDEHYAHLMLRQACHFCTVDALCGENPAQRHVIMRVKGCGRYEERLLQLDFLSSALAGQGFETTRTGDLLTAELSGVDANMLRQRLVVLGRLVMATRLMSRPLKTKKHVQEALKRFSDSLEQKDTA